MEQKNSGEEWVWIIVCNPGSKETFLGLHDTKDNSQFIPSFATKEDAESCLHGLPTEPGNKYEIQAIHINELQQTAQQEEFLIACVDGNGNIIKEDMQGEDSGS